MVWVVGGGVEWVLLLRLFVPGPACLFSLFAQKYFARHRKNDESQKEVERFQITLVFSC